MQEAKVPGWDAALLSNWWRWAGHAARLAERPDAVDCRSHLLARCRVQRDDPRASLATAMPLGNASVATSAGQPAAAGTIPYKPCVQIARRIRRGKRWLRTKRDGRRLSPFSSRACSGAHVPRAAARRAATTWPLDDRRYAVNTHEYDFASVPLLSLHLHDSCAKHGKTCPASGGGNNTKKMDFATTCR